MQTSLLAPRPARPVSIHDVAPLDGGHLGSELRAQATVKARTVEEPLSDWQVFTLLSGTAGGMLTLGIAALYGLSLLLP